MTPGDTLFIVNVRDKCLYLGGWIAVAEILSREEAATRLGEHRDELWNATDYVMANPLRLDRFRPACRVPDEIIDDLWLIDARYGQRTPKRDGNGGVDVQTFRTLRELVPGEDRKLRQLLR